MSNSHSEDRARWMIVVFRRHSCQFGEEKDESARDDDHDWGGEEDGASWKPSDRAIIRTKLFIAWYNDEKERERASERREMESRMTEEKTSSRNHWVFPLESQKGAKVLRRQLTTAEITKARRRKKGKRINSFVFFVAYSSQLPMIHRN